MKPQRSRKLRTLSLAAALLLGSYSAVAMANCEPPEWWPSWLPYTCKLK